MWVFFVIRYEVIMNAAVIHPVSRQWGPDKDDNKTRSADNWTRTAVELCRNSDDICCPWQDIIVAMIVRCSRSREMLDGRAAKPDVTICPFAGQLLKPRLDVGDDASMTDGIATSAHISHASSSTLQCTLSQVFYIITRLLPSQRLVQFVPRCPFCSAILSSIDSDSFVAWTTVD